MSRTHRVFLHADSSFHADNRAAKGKLKQRALRALCIRTKEALIEVNDPSYADVHFSVYKTDGQWILRKKKEVNNG